MAEVVSWECGNGHPTDAPENYPLRKCPYVVKGLPCTATVRRVGPGSVAANKKLDEKRSVVPNPAAPRTRPAPITPTPVQRPTDKRLPPPMMQLRHPGNTQIEEIA